ncbi:MAG: AmmeMemoRadiSam system protein B [Deltaproteobacteria bacterium]|nr:AmmeMemoRadiSam system protein B [Deltaproteobacteria bacterium]
MTDPTIRIRKPAVAGTFYADQRAALNAQLDQAWEARVPLPRPAPKALIAPHAGYFYSGAVAASAYALLQGAEHIRRVVLLGPSHHYALDRFAIPESSVWSTPLGLVGLGVRDLAALGERPDVLVSERVHEREHSLEVHVPFLQRVLPQRFELVPVLVGAVPPPQVAGLLAELWGEAETVIVVSSDLSHYLDQAACTQVDGETCRKVLALDPTGWRGDMACGCHAVAGLLSAARARHLRCEQLDARTSAAASGDTSRVVGYGAFAFWASEVAP